MKVSAIITTHNRCDLLKRAIDSVFKQTYKDIECIVIDDNSTDETKKYMEKKIKENSKLRYIRNENPNMSGGGFARNLGIKESKGEYIAFLDDDDEWFADKIEKQVSILDENKDVGIVICGRRIEYNSGKMYLEENPIDRGIKDYSKKILYNIIGVTSMMMFRKALLEKVGLFDEKIRFWQEYDLTIRLCQISKVAFLNEPLILYRINLQDKNRKSNQFEGWLETTRYIYNKYKELIEKLNENEKKCVTLLVYHDAVNRCDNMGDKKKKRKYLREIYRIQPTLKNYIKYFINVDRGNIIRLKLKLNWRKENV